ncbi:PLAC8-domain-containing protein [Rhizodiscina lignyota]|uniref:PLAC8-domain-containing protein n=1 Tax=Rhizodiscina lignyota TaxID=1504668 RepID=A0A9P4M8I0_9PEZI|nr:PLAC8-domain-containing protein [Rhizodiscina lignyota]
MSAPVENGAAPAAPAETPAAAPASAPAQATRQPIENDDIEHWKNRVNELLTQQGKTEAPVEGGKPWHAQLFGCFDPIDTCLITWCVPCVTFGRIHHRVHHHGDLEGYSPINTSCLLFCFSSCLSLIPFSLQRADIRKKYGLEGSFAVDLALGCCCGCCSLVQMDKEAEFQEKELLNGKAAQYSNGESTMEYKPTA